MTKIREISALSLVIASLAACAPSQDFQTTRSVFHNPYEELEIANGPVGPECDEAVRHQRECLIEGIVLVREGRFALDANGEPVRLTRAQGDRLRQREEAIEAKADLLSSLENGTPIPDGSPALPKPQD